MDILVDFLFTQIFVNKNKAKIRIIENSEIIFLKNKKKYNFNNFD